MPVYRLQTSLQSDSGLPRDQFVNSIYVDTSVGSPANFTAWCDALFGFYEGIRPQLSPVIAQNGHNTKIYLVGAPLETPPVYTQDLSLAGPVNGSAMPNEVASCLSFRGNPQPGWNRQSWYGRIYIGPLNESANEQITGGGAIPSGAFRLNVTARASAMAAALNAASGKWCVYSKLHSLATPVVQCFMDDEWDTQRSRGYRAQQKTIQTITQP